MYVWEEWEKESWRWLSLHTHTHTHVAVWFFCETSLPLFFSAWKFSWLYIQDSHANFHCHISSNPLLTHCTCTYLLLACYSHNFCCISAVYFRNQVHNLLFFFVPSVQLTSSMPPMQFTCHVKEDLQVNANINCWHYFWSLSLTNKFDLLLWHMHLSDHDIHS